MCAILVDLDAFYFLCVNITADMITLVHHQAGLCPSLVASRANTAPKSPAPQLNNHIFHLVLPLSVMGMQIYYVRFLPDTDIQCLSFPIKMLLL